MSRQTSVAPVGAPSGGMSRLALYLSKGLWPVSVVLGVYFTISIAVRLILPNSLTLDEAEQSLFSQYWLAGYGPQPPFYNWVQHVFVSLMGVSLLSLTLPKFAMLFLCYVFYGLAARELNSRPGFVALAVLSLLTLPQVSYMPQQDLTHTVAVLMATSLFLYGLVRTLSRPDWQGYVLVGLAIGIGILSKYNFVLFPAAALIAILCDSSWRRRVFDPRIILTASVTLIILLPHCVWLLDHLQLATERTLDKMIDANAPKGIFRVFRGVTSLVLACLAFGALAVVIFAAVFRRHLGTVLKADDRWTRLFGLTMLISLAGVLVIVLVTGTTKLTERWLDPYLLVLPLYMLVKLERAGADTGSRLRPLLPVFAVIMIIALMPQATKTLMGGTLGSYTRINYPMASLAEKISAEQQPVLIVAEGMHMAGNMRLQFPGVPIIDSKQRIDAPPPSQAIRGPVLAIWAEGDAERGALQPINLSSVKNLQLTASPPRSLALPYYYGDGKTMLNVGYIWLR